MFGVVCLHRYLRLREKYILCTFINVKTQEMINNDQSYSAIKRTMYN